MKAAYNPPAWTEMCCVSVFGEKVVMRQEEAAGGAAAVADLFVFVGFERGDDLVQFRNRLRAKDIQGRVIKCDAPIGWSPSCETDLPRICQVAHDCLQKSGLRIVLCRMVRCAARLLRRIAECEPDHGMY